MIHGVDNEMNINKNGYGSVNKLSVPFIWLDENQYTSHTPKYPFVMTCIMYMSIQCQT